MFGALPLSLLSMLAVFVAFASSTAGASDPPPIVPAEVIARELSPSAAPPPGRKKKIEYEPTGGASAPASRPVSRRIALPAIEFEFDSDRLTERARNQVEQLAEALAWDSLRPFQFAVQGHTDSVGDRSYNRALSLRRAKAVKRHLVAERVAVHRLVEVGFGEDFPLPGLPGDDGRNRRVEIVFLGPSEESPSPTLPRRPARKALLIGIDAYRNVSGLIGPVNDAQAMREFITSDLGFASKDVRLLLDGEATRANILREIDEWIIEGTRPGDEVFLYFSGHGFQLPDTSGDEPDRFDETLVPVDVAVSDDNTVEGMITDDEMAVLLARLPGRRVNVVIDACHSGTTDRISVAGEGWRYVKSPRRADGGPLRLGAVGAAGDSAPPIREAFVSTKDPELRTADLTVWAAVEAHQKALVDEELRGAPLSVFTGRLLSGARDAEADADSDGVVTRSELHAYLVRESEAYCTRHPNRCTRGLTPQIHGAAGTLDAPAFAAVSAVLPPRAKAAKDILVGATTTVESEAEIEVRISQGTRLEFGTELEVVVTSERDGYLVLLDIDSEGNLVQIFPNEFSVASGVPVQVGAGEPRTVPHPRDRSFRFRASPPAGLGTLIAVVTDEAPRLDRLVARHKDLSVVERPRAYLVEMAEVLRAGGGGPHRSVGTLVYETVKPAE